MRDSPSWASKMKFKCAILIAVVAIAAYVLGYYLIWPAVIPEPHYITVISEVQFTRGGTQGADAFMESITGFAKDMARRYHDVKIRYLATAEKGIFAAIVICESKRMKQ